MAVLIRLNKPFNVLCQFTDARGRPTLADYVSTPGVYPAGRLDFDSEGLVLLTDDGRLQHRIAAPEGKLAKTYWVQVEGAPDDSALRQLADGVELKDGLSAPALCRRIEPEGVRPRVPPVRYRAEIPTTWLELIITEGRNRQVRRMTAAVGHPTLRLIRVAIGPWKIGELQPGDSAREQVHLPEVKAGNTTRSSRNDRARAPDKPTRHNSNKPPPGTSRVQKPGARVQKPGAQKPAPPQRRPARKR